MCNLLKCWDKGAKAFRDFMIVEAGMFQGPAVFAI